MYIFDKPGGKLKHEYDLKGVLHVEPIIYDKKLINSNFQKDPQNNLNKYLNLQASTSGSSNQ